MMLLYYKSNNSYLKINPKIFNEIGTENLKTVFLYQFKNIMYVYMIFLIHLIF